MKKLKVIMFLFTAMFICVSGYAAEKAPVSKAGKEKAEASAPAKEKMLKSVPETETAPAQGKEISESYESTYREEFKKVKETTEAPQEASPYKAEEEKGKSPVKVKGTSELKPSGAMDKLEIEE